MPRFSYRAYDPTGREHGGEIDAPGLADALEMLARQGLRPFDTRPAEGGTAVATSGRWLSSTRLSPKALAQVVHELATLVSADLPLDEALRLALLNQPAGRSRIAVTQALEGVMGGASLSAALASTRAFPVYLTDMLRAGESAGGLASVLDELSKHLERVNEIREKVASALVYPAVLMGMAVIAVATILALLVPSLAGIFADANVEPPATVRMLLGVRELVTDHALTLLAVVVAISAGLLVLCRIPRFQLGVSKLLLSLPFVGSSIVEAESAQLARVLAVQLRSGVPLVEALRTAVGLVRSRYLKLRLGGVAEQLTQGAFLTRPLTECGLLPPLLLRLVRVGEETGRLEQMLTHAAQVFERKGERRLERLVGLITPVMTILIGIGVGSLVLSVMDAVLSINDMVLR